MQAIPVNHVVVKPAHNRLLLIADWIGTLVFAVEGALAAIAGEMDLLGLMVLAFATALGGGIIRDLLLGDIPPNSIRDWRYSVVAFAGGAAAFLFYHSVRQVPMPVIIDLDAAGLSLFAVSGASKALDFKLHPLLAVLMGGITGVGGGTVRDVFLAKIPTVLRADVYATAALAGAAVMVVGCKLNLSRRWMMICGGAVCFGLRLLSVHEHWNLPRIDLH
jgi:uncharacterized membrane protein YeiH